MSFVDDVERNGFAVVPDLLAADAHTALLPAFEGAFGRGGRRDGLAIEAVRAAAAAPAVRRVVEAILGRDAVVTKATLFDKTPAANWLVPWHQDTTIALRERRECPGFGPWSCKDGVTHVRPPRFVLDGMLAVRLDLDGATQGAGSLRVLAGTHRNGLLDSEEIQRLRRAQPATLCAVPARGALVLRPLLLHASSKAMMAEPEASLASRATRRRVVHLEFANVRLPEGVHWHEWWPTPSP
ncbi:MAG: phytanoyl-CoA dioxygenase family protein [Planctomycetota bacterium]